MKHPNMTPGKAVRKFCLGCVEGFKNVNGCQGSEMVDGPCPLYEYRMGKGRPSVKLIRKYCLYCCNNSTDAIRECPDKKCFLFPYRMGKNPAYKSKSVNNLPQTA